MEGRAGNSSLKCWKLPKPRALQEVLNKLLTKNCWGIILFLSAIEILADIFPIVRRAISRGFGTSHLLLTPQQYY